MNNDQNEKREPAFGWLAASGCAVVFFAFVFAFLIMMAGIPSGH